LFGAEYFKTGFWFKKQETLEAEKGGAAGALQEQEEQEQEQEEEEEQEQEQQEQEEEQQEQEERRRGVLPNSNTQVYHTPCISLCTHMSERSGGRGETSIVEAAARRYQVRAALRVADINLI
jgi:hypothetical protein